MVSLLFFSQFFFYTRNLFLERWSFPFWSTTARLYFFRDQWSAKKTTNIVTAWKFLGCLDFLTFEVATLREDLASGLSVILPLSVERSFGNFSVVWHVYLGIIPNIPKEPLKKDGCFFFYACNCNSQNNKPLKAWDRSFTYRYFCCWWLKGWKGCCDRRSICRVMRVPLNDSGWKTVGVSPSSICPVNIYDRYLNTPRIMQKTVLIWGPWALF